MKTFRSNIPGFPVFFQRMGHAITDGAETLMESKGTGWREQGGRLLGQLEGEEGSGG